MPQLELKKFSTTIYKDASTADQKQVPAIATLDAYFEGATVNGNVTVQTGAAGTLITVYNIGRLKNGDNIQVGVDATKTLTVVTTTGYPSDTQIYLKSTTGNAMTLFTGDRLIVTNRRPTLYADSLAVISIGNNIQTSSLSGYVEFYIADTRFDYIISATGLTSRLFTDAEGGWTRGNSVWINSKNFASIQEAIDALPAQGGIVLIPSGTYTQSTTIYTPCDRPCYLIGEGSFFGGGKATVIKNNTGSDILRLRGNGSKVQGITFDGDTVAAQANEETGRGIVFGRRNITDPYPFPGATPGNTEIQNGLSDVGKNMTAEDCVVRNTGGYSVSIPGDGNLSGGGSETGRQTNLSLSIFVTLNRVTCIAAKRWGGIFVGAGCTTVNVRDSSFIAMGADIAPAGSFYVYLSGSVGVRFDHTTFEGRCPLTTASSAWVRLGGTSHLISNCWFEEDSGDSAGHTPEYFIRLPNGSVGTTVDHCHFVRGGDTGGRLKIILADNTTRGFQLRTPDAICSTTVRPAGSYTDTTMINLGGNTNTQFEVVGSGQVFDQIAQLIYPIQYANVPSDSTFIGRRNFKPPQVSDTIKADGSLCETPGAALGMAMNWDLANDSTGIGCMEYEWGGLNAGRRLVNNAPPMTKAQRDGRGAGFVNGDIIRVTDAPAAHQIQIRHGGVWNWLTFTANVGGD